MWYQLYLSISRKLHSLVERYSDSVPFTSFTSVKEVKGTLDYYFYTIISHGEQNE